MTPSDLRPLGIGEILDRAVTLFVRRFAVLMLILALVAIPVAILQYAATPSTAGLTDDIGRLLTLPAGHPDEQRAILRQISQHNRVGALGLVLVLVNAILGALSATACIVAVAQAYRGRMPSVREVYREALGRWPAQLAAAVAYLGFAFVLAIVLGICVFFVILAIGLLAQVSRVAATVTGIAAAVIVAVVVLAPIVLLYFAAQMTIVSIALEEPNPVRGIAHGLRRTLSPVLFWRSMLVACIVFAVAFIGTFILLGAAAGLSALTHLTAVYPVVAVIGGIALSALQTTFIVIYAFDVRVRREGYDLALVARQAAASEGT